MGKYDPKPEEVDVSAAVGAVLAVKDDEEAVSHEEYCCNPLLTTKHLPLIRELSKWPQKSVLKY